MNAAHQFRHFYAARVFAFLSLILALALGGGCLAPKSPTSAPDRADRILAGHNFTDTRISVAPADGMEPTGVWRVHGKHNVVYLAATSHLITRDQVPFPSTFYGAYSDSHEIYVEADTKASRLSEIAMTFRMLNWIRKHRADFFYPRGLSLADELKPETLTRVKEFYGPDFKKVERMRPVFLVFMAQAQRMGEQFIETGGVEDVFLARARVDGKPLRELDDSSVNAVALLAIDEMIYQIRRDVEKSGPDKVVDAAISGATEEIVQSDWRRGDLGEAEQEVLEMKATAPDLYAKIGPERNRKWLPKILKALDARKNVMILAGAAHFPGPDGLIALLENAGHKVEQLYGIDTNVALNQSKASREEAR